MGTAVSRQIRMEVGSAIGVCICRTVVLSAERPLRGGGQCVRLVTLLSVLGLLVTAPPVIQVCTLERKKELMSMCVNECRRVHTADTTVVSGNGSLTKIWTRVRRSGATMNVCLETTLIHNSKRFPCFSTTYRLILVPLLLLSSGFVLWGLVLFFCWLDGWDGGGGEGFLKSGGHLYDTALGGVECR